MTKKTTLDATVGNPLSILLRMAVPLVVGSFFQQLYSFVDTLIIGRYLGTDALAAVGVTGALNFLVLGFTMGAAIGFCIPIAQKVGAGERDEVGKYFWNGLYLSLIFGLVISLGVSFFVRPLLLFMNTSETHIDMATEYLTIIFIGQITTVLYNFLSGVIRAFGDTKRPFYFLLISSLINVLLDLLFVAVIPLGVSGAAIATVISQAISVLLCIWWIRARLPLIRKVGDGGEALTGLSLPHVKNLAIIGLPLGLEYSVTSIGNVALQSSINTLGDVVAASQVCGEKIRQMLTLPLESLGMAVATYAGQNFGAKRLDRIEKGVKSGLTIVAVYSAAAWALVAIFKRPLVALLLGTVTSPEALGSIEYLSVISTLFVFHGSLMIFRNTVQGMGYSASTLASSVMEIIGRTLAGVLAVKFTSFFLICVSAPMAWILALLCCIVLYLIIMKKHKNKDKCNI